jgi:hypothetical protein
MPAGSIHGLLRHAILGQQKNRSSFLLLNCWQNISNQTAEV